MDKQLTAFPADDRQLLVTGSPLEIILGFAKPLKLHRQLTLLHLVIGEDLQVTSETELRADSDEPLGGVVLVPFEGIAVVHGELVMEVVIALSNSNNSRHEVITGSVLVVERTFTEPVCQGVDTECGLYMPISTRS